MVTYHVQLMYVEMFIYQMHRSIYIQLDKGNYRSCVYNNNYTPCLGLSYHYAILPGDRQQSPTYREFHHPNSSLDTR
jgi:hypothetical protein